MNSYTRRSFLQTTAAATGAVVVSSMFDGRLIKFAYAENAGYFEREFGISDALCHEILAKALSKGGDFADLYFENTIANTLALEDGKVNRAYSEVELGVGIRTVRGEQTGYAFTQELTKEAILVAASTAATIADSSAKKVSTIFTSAKTRNYYPLNRLWTEIPFESRIPLVQTLNDLCFALSPNVVKVQATFSDEQKRCLVVSSDGGKFEDLMPLNYLLASVVAEKKGQRQRAYYSRGGRYDFSAYTPQLVNFVANESVDRVLILFDAVSPPAGEMPVVLGPGSPGVLLHEAIGHGMEADFNRKKISIYSTMIGKPVAEPFVNIVDNATNEFFRGSINADDEGSPGQSTLLVEKGILKSYLHDKISSKIFKVKSTGNGRRESYRFAPMPRMRNTYMLAGPDAPEDVIKSVKKGIYCKDLSNGQVRIGEGDFAFFVTQGYLIEDGKLTAPIKDINIMGNGPKVLKNVTKVGSDFKIFNGGTGYCGKNGQRVPVSFGLPTILVNSLTVGGIKSQEA